MATRVGVGVINENDNSKIQALKQQINSLNEEIFILSTEKEDLEKLPKELSEKIGKLKEQVESLTNEKIALETENAKLKEQVESLTKTVDTPNKGKKTE